MVEIAVFAIAAALALRVLATRAVRREATEHPFAAFALAAALVGCVTALAWVAVVSPPLRHVAAAATFVLVFVAWWRSRVDYGSGVRQPAGSLGLRASLAAIDDRSFYRGEAARHGPVFKMSQFGRPVACVVGLERAHRILVDHADALAPAVLPYNRLLSKGVLRYMTGADHKAEAPAFRAAFAKMDLAGAEDTLRADLRRELASLAEESSRTPGGCAARPAFERWVVAAIARVFIGFAPDAPRVDAFRRRVAQLVHQRRGGARLRATLQEGLAGVTTLLRDADREHRAGSASIAGGTALALLVASDPDSLDRPARAENLAMIARVASSDLTGLMDWIAWFLAGAPAWRDAVCAHGRTAGVTGGSLPLDPATAIVMETLRLEQSEHLYRRTVKPFEVDGRVIPAGWILRICVNESHRDPSIFPDPHRFDPSRFVDRTYTRREYSPFGGHTHGCMGGHLAIFLGRLLVEELALGYDVDVVRDGPFERANRHRDHWHPSSARRVVLRPRLASTPVRETPAVTVP